MNQEQQIKIETEREKQIALSLVNAIYGSLSKVKSDTVVGVSMEFASILQSAANQINDIQIESGVNDAQENSKSIE